MADNVEVTPGVGKTIMTHDLGGEQVQAIQGVPLAVKKTVVGTTTYIAFASPGTTEATAGWRAMKIDESSGMVITWADGDDAFNNVATDLTALIYS